MEFTLCITRVQKDKVFLCGLYKKGIAYYGESSTPMDALRRAIANAKFGIGVKVRLAV